MKTIKVQKSKLKAKRTFLKKGTCSRTFFYLLNREFGYPKEQEERAIDPLAGGILQLGYQCGMIWGASMAIGAESYRKCENTSQAVAMSIKATQLMMASFINRTDTIECEEITNTDFKNKWSFTKYMLSGKFVGCYKLTGKWAPEAIQSAVAGLSAEVHVNTLQPISCASEVVLKMGGTEEESVMVAGFAGGLGLSGNACGALAAAIWKNTLARVRNENWKPTLSDPVSEKILNEFYEVTDYEMECHKICGSHFKSIEEHSEFIKNGGCSKLMAVLANDNYSEEK